VRPGADALEVLRIAPTPTLGAALSRSKIAAGLRRVVANDEWRNERLDRQRWWVASTTLTF
jgi:hypothetical protein